MNESVSATEERQKRIKRKKEMFIFGSAVFLEALRGDEAKTKELLRRCTDEERRHILDTINNIKSWLVDFN